MSRSFQTTTMKQGKMNSTERMDQGWERLQPILDKEFPPKKKNRKGFWILLVAGLMSLALGAYIIIIKKNISQVTQALPIAAKSIKISDESNATIAKTATLIAKNSKLQDSKNILEVATLKNTISNNKSSKVTNEVQSNALTFNNNLKIQENKTTTGSTPSTTKVSKESKVIPRTSFTYNPPVDKIKTIALSRKPPAHEPIVISKVPTLPMITINPTDNRPLLSIKHYTTITNEQNNTKSTWALSSKAFVVPSLENLGTQLGLAYTRQIKKLYYQANLGVGKYFSDFPLETLTLQSSNSVISDDDLENTPGAPEGPVNSNGFGGGDNRTGLDRYEQFNVSPYWNAKMSYAFGSLGLGYDLSNKIRLGSQIGVEYYKLNLTSEVRNSVPEGVHSMPVTTATYYDLQAFCELSSQYSITSKLDLTLGVRKSISNKLIAEKYTTNTDKILLGLRYNI